MADDTLARVHDRQHGSPRFHPPEANDAARTSSESCRSLVPYGRTDGCLYVLDWYDRYHCYQDAPADPKGVDRGHGRLYRIVHSERPKPRYEDISKLTESELIAALADPNLFVRQRSQLELAERRIDPGSAMALELETLVNQVESLTTKLHAIWALSGSGGLRESFLLSLLDHANPEVRAWAVRLAGDLFPSDPSLVATLPIHSPTRSSAGSSGRTSSPLPASVKNS